MTTGCDLYDSSLSDSVSQPDYESNVPNSADEDINSFAANVSAQIMPQLDQRLVLPVNLAAKESTGAVNCSNFHSDPVGKMGFSNGLHIGNGMDETSRADLSEDISLHQPSPQQEQQRLLQSQLKADSPLESANTDPVLGLSSSNSGLPTVTPSNIGGPIGPTSDSESHRVGYSVAGSENLPVPNSSQKEISDIPIVTPASMTSISESAKSAAVLPLSHEELDRIPSSMFNGMLLSSVVKEQDNSFINNPRTVTRTSNSIEVKNILSSATTAAHAGLYGVEIPTTKLVLPAPQLLSRSDEDISAASEQCRGMLPSATGSGTGIGSSRWTIEDEDVDMSPENSMPPNASNDVESAGEERNGGDGLTALIASDAYTKAAVSQHIIVSWESISS